MTALSLRGLSKRFGSVAAVDDVSLDIAAGQFVCLLGPSGCGKTTLLRLIAGLEEPSAGSLVVDGQDYTQRPSHTRGFGMVFQSLALFPHLSVAENIAYPLAIRGVDKVIRARRVAELLDLVRLPGLGERRIHELSGGQRQRVAIARALALEPKLFLLDEPLSALDANLREHMQFELKQLQRRLGVTTILVTHDQKEALTLADHLIVMDRGRVQQAGPPMEVYRDPANAFVAGFIGNTNLLPCRVKGRTVELFGVSLPLDPADRVKTGDGPALLSVRPEDVRFAGQGLPGRVMFLRDLGESVQVVIDCFGHEVSAIFSPRERPQVVLGQIVQLVFEPGHRVILPP